MKLLVPLMLLLAMLSGCASKEEVDPGLDGPPNADTQPIIIDDTANQRPDDSSQNQADTNTSSVFDDAAGANTSAISDVNLSPQALLAEKESPLATRIIYFEYNSAKVNQDSMNILQTHGDFISENGNVHVRLEGHADERGSREFNVALGDRRNQSVRRMLLFQGASTDQIDTVSYGEELPAVLGHNEEAWNKNRRVELIYEVK